AEIEPLPGDRVDAMGGVAGEREALGDEGTGKRQAKREGARLAERRDGAEPMAEAPLQLEAEDVFIAADDPARDLGALGPDQRRAVALERQDGERPAGQEMLDRAAAMRPFVGNRDHDTGLGVGPL